MGKTIVTVEPGKTDLYIIREFDAPRELVFKAYTDPELYKQWVGPAKYKMELDVFEPVSGGSWRYTSSDDAGNSFSFHGVNHEVLAPERIIGTFEFDGMPEAGHVCLETARFEELEGGRTRVTGHSVFQTVEDRDGMVQSGMEEGVQEGFERLDALLATLQ